MTINELFKVWLHNRNPNSKIMVWDRELGEYIFDSDDFKNSNYLIKEIENTEVSCFHQYYDEKLNKEVLIINVDNIYERDCKGGKKMTDEEIKEEENNVGISFKKSYEELEKENEQLKVRLGIAEHDREHNDYELTETYELIAELKAQIEQLSNDNHVLKTQQEQIEEMKCCGNCKHNVYNCGERYCEYDWNRENDCRNKNQWGLVK